MKRRLRTSIFRATYTYRLSYAALLLSIASGMGCDSSDLSLAPVSGVLRRGSEPLVDYRIIAFPSSGPIASATTDGAGHFVFRTGDANGVVVASHTIVLTPPSKPGDFAMPGLGETITCPAIDTRAGIDPALQIRDESPLTLTLTDSEARDIEIDVEAKTVLDAD